MEVCLICGKNAILCRHNCVYPDTLLRAAFGDCDDEYAYKLKESLSILSEKKGRLKINDKRIERVRERQVVRFDNKTITAEYQEIKEPVPFIDLGLWAMGVRFFVDGVEFDIGLSRADATVEKSSIIERRSDITPDKTRYGVCNIGGNVIRRDEIISEIVSAMVNGKLTTSEAVENLFDDLITSDVLCGRDNYAIAVKELRLAYDRGKISCDPTLLLLLSFYPHASDVDERYKLPYIMDDRISLFLINKTIDELTAIVRLSVYNLYPLSHAKKNILELVTVKIGSKSGLEIIAKNIFKIGFQNDNRCEKIRELISQLTF